MTGLFKGVYMVDRYLEGNRIVSHPTKDDTKTIEEYKRDHQYINRECIQLRSEKTGLHNIIIDLQGKIELLNNTVARFKAENNILKEKLDKALKVEEKPIVQEDNNSSGIHLTMKK